LKGKRQSSTTRKRRGDQASGKQTLKPRRRVRRGEAEGQRAERPRHYVTVSPGSLRQGERERRLSESLAGNRGRKTTQVGQSVMQKPYESGATECPRRGGRGSQAGEKEGDTGGALGVEEATQGNVSVGRGRNVVKCSCVKTTSGGKKFRRGKWAGARRDRGTGRKTRRGNRAADGGNPEDDPSGSRNNQASFYRMVRKVVCGSWGGSGKIRMTTKREDIYRRTGVGLDRNQVLLREERNWSASIRRGRR